jgi:ribosome maturation factor RimP
LDDTELLGPRYVLEVSSPGIERPIRWVEHWHRFVGEDVKVRLAGIGRVRATILGVENDRVSLKLENGEVVEASIEEARDATLFVDWDNLDTSVAASRPKIKE